MKKKTTMWGFVCVSPKILSDYASYSDFYSIVFSNVLQC